MSAIQLRILWLALVPLGALLWEVRVEDTAYEDHALRLRIDDLRTSAANVDAFALSARFALLPSYDPLVETLQSTRAAARSLRAVVAGNGEMARALDALMVQLQARTSAIEEIKSRRGALTYTETQLPALLANEVTDAALLAELRADLVAYLLAPSQDSRKQLDATAARASPKVQAHIKQMTDSRYALERAAYEIITASLATDAAAFAHAQESSMAAHRRTARNGRAALLAAAALGFLAAPWLVRRTVAHARAREDHDV
jgi:hypothetical protein